MANDLNLQTDLATQEPLRGLMEPDALAVWETDAVGEIVADSLSWRVFTGQTLEEWIGRGWLDAVHPQDRTEVEWQWRDAIAARRGIDMEYRLKRAKGGYQWTNMRAVPIFGPQGELAKWSGVNIDIHARKVAEVALRESEEKYRGLFDSIDEGFCIIEMIYDEQGKAVNYRFLEANPAFEVHTGLRNVVGTTVRDHAPLQGRWYEIYGDIALTGKPQRFTQRAEALERDFDVYAFRIGGSGENRVAVLFRDITERKRSEAAATLLAEVAADLAEMNSVTGTLELLAAKIGRHFAVRQCAIAECDANSSLKAMYDWCSSGGAHSIEGHHLLENFLSGSLGGEEAAQATAVVVNDAHVDSSLQAGPGIRSFALVPTMREGRCVFVISVNDGAPRSWRAEDIELLREAAARIWAAVERAHTEEALRQSEERLRLIVENARDYAIFSMDLDLRITSWNSGAEALLGYSQDEILGQRADVIFSSEDRHARVPELEAETAILRGRASDERWHIRKNGTPLWGSGVMMAMHNAEGRTVGLVKIFRDVTETRAAQKALEESKGKLIEALRENENARREEEAAGRAKDHFLAVLSHELRTPLAPVLLTTMTLQRRSDLSEPVSKGLEMIRRNVQLECHLIDDLLDLTRIARGRLEIARDPVDLHEVIRDAVDVSNPDLDFKKQELEVQLEADRSIVIGDATRLQQLIWNLLKNASKFTPANGRICVVSQRTRDRIMVRVTDSGAGIRSERLAVIFDAFTQGEQSTFSEYGGLGLGLAIAKATVEAHHGTIEATSAGPGQGSSFSFEIPLAPSSTA